MNPDKLERFEIFLPRYLAGLGVAFFGLQNKKCFETNTDAR
jgi:hypothetical protein